MLYLKWFPGVCFSIWVTTTASELVENENECSLFVNAKGTGGYTLQKKKERKNNKVQIGHFLFPMKAWKYL